MNFSVTWTVGQQLMRINAADHTVLSGPCWWPHLSIQTPQTWDDKLLQINCAQSGRFILQHTKHTHRNIMWDESIDINSYCYYHNYITFYIYIYLQADLHVVIRRGVLQHDPLVNCRFVLLVCGAHSIKASVTPTDEEQQVDQLTSD